MFSKLFIKDYKDTSNPVVRSRYGNAAGIIGIVVNLILGSIKLTVGVLSHSISIMADAVNNISDMASSALTIAGFKLVNKKPDRKHPYGYARYEYVAGFVISLFMLVMGAIFAKESITKIFRPEEISIDSATYIVMGSAVIIKFGQFLAFKEFAKAISSNTIEATATETRNDVITTAGILLSMVVMGVFKINIDAYVGLAVSCLVIYSSFDAIKEVLEPIIGIAPTDEQVEAITKKILSYDIVLGIHDMIIHNYGVNNDIVSVHVEVDSSKDIIEIHDQIDNIEAEANRDLGIILTIHMDPVVVKNPFVDELKVKVKEALNNLDKDLLFHDFRIVDGPTHINAVFDVVVPQESKLEKEDIVAFLKDNVKADRTIYFVIKVDRPFCK